jgi:hypothetical protein
LFVCVCVRGERECACVCACVHPYRSMGSPEPLAPARWSGCSLPMPMNGSPPTESPACAARKPGSAGKSSDCIVNSDSLARSSISDRSVSTAARRPVKPFREADPWQTGHRRVCARACVRAGGRRELLMEALENGGIIWPWPLESPPPRNCPSTELMPLALPPVGKAFQKL